jgi:hypothetical protein
MKVALCMFWQPRVINNPYTFQSHEEWIIKKYDTDVFTHSWVSGKDIIFNYSVLVNLEEYVDYEDKNTIDIILKKYQPKNFKFDQPRSFTFDDISRNKVKDFIRLKTTTSSARYKINNNVKNASNIDASDIISKHASYKYIVVLA